jgi:hypothetical protein
MESDPDSNKTSLKIITLLIIHPDLYIVNVNRDIDELGSATCDIIKSDLTGFYK